MMRVLITGSALSAAALDPLQLGQHVVGLDHVRIELDLEGGVGRADLGDALDLRVAHRVGDRQALEEGLERHLLVDLDEDVLVAAEGISVLHASLRLLFTFSLAAIASRATSRASGCGTRRPRTASVVGKRRAAAAWSDAADLELVRARAPAARCACGAILVPDDQLAEQRVVEGRHGSRHRACVSKRTPGPPGMREVADRARERA